MMEKEELDSLLWRYQNDLCTDEERQKVEQWYDALQAGDPASFSTYDLESIRHSIRGKLSITLPAKKGIVQKFPAHWLAAGLVAAGLAAIFYIFYPSDNDGNKTLAVNADQFQLITNNTVSDTSVKLADGSSVKLFPGAALRYPAKFSGNKREVYLEGDGLFSVSKDSTRPFYVFSDQLVIKVLGTSFVVRSQKGKSSVAVHSGKVAVFKNQSGQMPENAVTGKLSVVLTPNQQAIYQAGSDSLHTSLVEAPRLLTSRIPGAPVGLRFENVALDSVLQALGETYGIAIGASNPSLFKCRFTGDISEPSLSLYDKLQMLCQAIDAIYEIHGVDIIIKGKGCN